MKVSWFSLDVIIFHTLSSSPQ